MIFVSPRFFGITRVRVISGEFWGRRGPVDGIAADPIYLDISVPPGRQIQSWRWDFGDGRASVTTTGPTTKHVFTVNKTYTVYEKTL